MEDEVRALNDREKKLNSSIQHSQATESDLRKEFEKAIDLHKEQEEVLLRKLRDNEEVIQRYAISNLHMSARQADTYENGSYGLQGERQGKQFADRCR